MKRMIFSPILIAITTSIVVAVNEDVCAANVAASAKVEIEGIIANGGIIDNDIKIGYAPHGTTNAVVTINDEKFVEASEAGSQTWTPAKGGTHVFRHVVDGNELTATYFVPSQMSLEGLSVTMIKPLGLALDFEVRGASDDDDGSVFEVMKISDNGAMTNAAKSLSGDVACLNGAHRIYWNTARDGITIANEKLTVSVVHRKMPQYCIVDLSGGANTTSYPVTYCDLPPIGGFNVDEYKTTKLVLRRCPAGDDPLGRYTITNDFYAGLFEVTQKQWELVTGTIINKYKIRDDAWPAANIYSMSAIRSDDDATDTTFCGRLNNRTGLDFDLPSWEHWEYACRAGTTTEWCFGNDESKAGEYMWYLGNSVQQQEVGTRKPNKWGFYDMHGNAAERCLDDRFRGGCWYNSAAYCKTTASCWGTDFPYGHDSKGVIYGFRVFMTVK